MLRVLLFFTNLCLFVNSDEIPVKIEIDISKGGDDRGHFKDPTTKVALLHHSLDIVIKDFVATDVSCGTKSTQFSFESPYYHKLINGKKSIIIKVKKVNEDMNTLWDCTVTQKRDREKELDTREKDIKVHIQFQLRVKGTKSPDVTINSKAVKFKQTDLSETQFDGIADNCYENGETVNVIFTDSSKKGHLQIRYEDASGKEVFRSNAISYEHPVYFSAMMLNNDNYKIDCSLIIKNMTYTYRIIFKRSDRTSESFFEISINNLKLPPVQKSEDKYHFNFFHEEDLDLLVSCEKTGEKTPGYIMFAGNEEDQNKDFSRDVTVESWKRTIKLSTEDMDDKHLKCMFITDPPSRPHRSADILFIRDRKDPYLSGLSPKGIAYQYPANDTTWVTHYKYNVGEVIELMCATKEDHLIMYGHDLLLKKPKGAKYISNEMTLSEKHDGKTIICEKLKGGKKAVISLEKNIIQDSPHNEDIIIIISCSVTGLLIVMAIFLAFLWRASKKKNATKDSCENLVHQFKSPIATIRSQWSNRGCTNGTMLENTFYNGGPAYAYPHRRENTNSAEYHYIEVNDDIIKRHNELLKEHNNMAYMIKKSIQEGCNNSDYIQPYATSTLQSSSTNEEYRSADTNKSYSNWNTGTKSPINDSEDQNVLANKQKQITGQQPANNCYNNEMDGKIISNLQPNTYSSYNNVNKDIEDSDQVENYWYNSEKAEEKVGKLQPNTNISYSNLKKDLENMQEIQADKPNNVNYNNVWLHEAGLEGNLVDPAYSELPRLKL